MLVIALVHQGSLVVIENQHGDYEMPSTFIRVDEAFDLPLMIAIRNLLGWRAEPGGLLGKDVLPSGVERLVTSAFFDGDRRQLGTVPDVAVRRLRRDEIRSFIEDGRLAELAELACS